MNRTAITFSSLVMTFAGLLFLSHIRGTLNSAKEHKELADFWKQRVAREQLKKLIVKGQFADFKQDVAGLIPERIEKNKVGVEKQKLRNLASVIPHEGTHEIILGYSAEKFLKKGKELIKKRQFKKGVESLRRLIDKFPDSYHVVEAQYLIMESHSQQNKDDKVLAAVEKLVENFPLNRLTGYALLKVGGVYEADGRHDDAIKIYKTIIAVYQEKALVEQAKKAVVELEL